MKAKFVIAIGRLVFAVNFALLFVSSQHIVRAAGPRNGNASSRRRRKRVSWLPVFPPAPIFENKSKRRLRRNFRESSSN